MLKLRWHIIFSSHNIRGYKKYQPCYCNKHATMLCLFLYILVCVVGSGSTAAQLSLRHALPSAAILNFRPRITMPIYECYQWTECCVYLLSIVFGYSNNVLQMILTAFEKVGSETLFRVTEETQESNKHSEQLLSKTEMRIIIIIIIIMEAFIKRRIPGKTTHSKALQYNSNKVVIKLKLY